MSRIVAVLIIFSGVALIANCSRVSFGIANVPAYFGAYERHSDLSYGVDARERLDVYVPRGAANRPVIVFWHGGTWVRGSKDQYRFVGATLAAAGYVVVVPNYRLFPQARFPQFAEDGAQVVRWARGNASRFGGDPDALFLMGHSAGAHTAATLALDERYLRAVHGDPSWIRGWIGMSGPWALELRTPYLEAVFPQPYRPADWQPLALVKGSSPPALILHGVSDAMVHAREAVLLEQKLLEAGVAAECHLYSYATHTDTVGAFSLVRNDTATTLADVSRFIERTLAGHPARVPCTDFRRRSEWSPGQPARFDGW